MSWQGKTAFITGGVSGIGLGIAQAFAAAGMRLALSYRTKRTATRQRRGLRKTGMKRRCSWRWT